MFIHKVIFNEKPNGLFKLITFGTKDNVMVRKVRKPRVKIETKHSRLRNTLIYSSVYLYGQLEGNLRLYNPKKLAKYLKENIMYIFPHDKILRQSHE